MVFRYYLDSIGVVSRDARRKRVFDQQGRHLGVKGARTACILANGFERARGELVSVVNRRRRSRLQFSTLVPSRTMCLIHALHSILFPSILQSPMQFLNAGEP
ncbi:hypothetical protein D8B26_004146 [Coccidioides posadasii str. Silveira]|uniref:uncharacterized protein n=1 Tax=Coccidioides posadasii (strain RMSCC 757 / Silveira) TaxID=443226 RepID=UPI001BF058B0|nr:hypothetical protein D8B26_004146 [Coccidioides posadasii str. Silveira]